MDSSTAIPTGVASSHIAARSKNKLDVSTPSGEGHPSPLVGATFGI